MTKHVSQDDRRRMIVNAASELIEEQGVLALSMRAVADRAGITRVWLYNYFPDVDAVMLGVWNQWRIDLAGTTDFEPPRGRSVRDYLTNLVTLWLQMPTAAAMIGLHASTYMGMANDGPSSFIRTINADVERRWTLPLIASGVEHDRAVAAVVRVQASGLSTIIAFRRGLLTKENTVKTLNELISATVPAHWQLSDREWN